MLTLGGSGTVCAVERVRQGCVMPKPSRIVIRVFVLLAVLMGTYLA